MTSDQKYAIQTGVSIGLGLFAWEIGQNLLIEPLGRTVAVFASGLLAAFLAGTTHWFLGKSIRTK